MLPGRPSGTFSSSSPASSLGLLGTEVPSAATVAGTGAYLNLKVGPSADGFKQIGRRTPPTDPTSALSVEEVVVRFELISWPSACGRFASSPAPSRRCARSGAGW